MEGPRLEISFRPVSWDDDGPFLFRVYAAVREPELEQTGWTAEQKEAFCRQQFEAQQFHYRKYYPEAVFEVVEVGGVSAGRLYVSRWQREIRIIDIAMLPGFQGRGVGSRVMERLIAESEACGKPLSIHVEKFNPALRWYERLGFVPVEDKGVYLLMHRVPGGGS